MRIEFLDAGDVVIEETSTIIVESDSPSQAIPYTFESVTPANAAWTRLSIERFTTDPETDLAGSFIADAAFLHVAGTTELPVFMSEPSSEQTVNFGGPVQLSIEVSSPTAVTYQWYHAGEKVSTEQDYSFIAGGDSGGTYYVVATNDAGPVIGALTELTVEFQFQDTDGDLISDSDETNLYGTDPSRADTDFDGISDYHELFVFLTDPLDATSLLIITDFAISGDDIELTFLTRPGISYFVESSPDLSQWQTMGSTITATGTVSTVVFTRPISEPPLNFFRIGPLP